MFVLMKNITEVSSTEINKENYTVIEALNGLYANDIQTMLPYLVFKSYCYNQEILFVTSPYALKALLYFLKRHTYSQFYSLENIVCYDVPNVFARFGMMYCLFSRRFNTRIRVYVCTPELFKVPSVFNIYSSAAWLEREIWDLFGIYFEGNTDLRRILTDYGFQGHPLRKDFPLTGFFDLSYHETTQGVRYAPTQLAAEFRKLDIQSPWTLALV